MFDVAEKSIAELRAALVAGETTAVELVHAYRERIARYDRPAAGSPAGPSPGAVGGQAADGAAGDPAGAAPDGGVPLNSVVVDNPRALEEARASDERRATGAVLGPLDGIPYTAKDSFMVAGLTVAAGSPAFAGLVAQWDAFTIERLRAAGAVLLGLTNMPPMANGGMQRGLYGRAESPYNADFLTSAFASGSSNGSGTATAASFAAFGLGEETWSSGRAPASCNALCAYTPSRGVISVRGNWPLVPTMDVVVPHTRTMADLLEVLDVIVADDHTARGDFWRVQPWIAVPASAAVRPVSYRALAEQAGGQESRQSGDRQLGDQPGHRSALAGTRLGVPRMYINADPDAGTGPVCDAGHPATPGLGGPMGRRIQTRGSVIALWESARGALEAAGAVVVEVDFPVVSRYEGDRTGAPTVSTRGLVSAEYLHTEVTELSAWAWEDFLQANGDPRLHTLAQVDGTRISPHPPGALADRYHGFDDGIAAFPDLIRAGGVRELTALPGLAGGLAGLERTREADLEDWMDELGLDAVLFPALADVGPADADVNPLSAEVAWRNGVWVANGNLVPRHLGIPTVTVPMGTAADIGMPFGLTFAGRAYDDTTLLRLACAFEATGRRRTPPPRTTTPATTPTTIDVPGRCAVAGSVRAGARPTLIPPTHGSRDGSPHGRGIMSTTHPSATPNTGPSGSSPYRAVNPATGQTVSEHPPATDEQVEQAIGAAHRAFQDWRSREIGERAGVVARIAELFQERTEELAQTITREMGKPIAESRDEAGFAAEIFRYYAQNGPRLTADQILEDTDGASNVIQRRPLGVLLGIMPWNYPYYQVARFAAPNLVAGNTIVLKHAEIVPESALAIEQLLRDAGVPEGVYQNLFATHDQVATIIADPRVLGVSLTGSERAGAAVAELAGRHLKKAVLELGGSDPYVILSTDDPRQAARDALAIRLENTGQACNSNKRLIVMDDAFDDFVAELVDRVCELKPGDPAAGQDNTFGPLSSEPAANRLVDQIQRAMAAGGTLHVGGTRLDQDGFYVRPAVITGIPQDSEIYREEFFGPVLAVYRVSSDEQALALANNTPYGLGSAVFATEPGRAERFAEQLDAGMVGANQSPPEAANMPFGGVKRSGYGRELGPLGMDEFVNKRLMSVAKES